MGFRSSISLLPAIIATGVWLFPRRVYLPLDTPAFAGRTIRPDAVILRLQGDGGGSSVPVREGRSRGDPAPSRAHEYHRNREVLGDVRAFRGRGGGLGAGPESPGSPGVVAGRNRPRASRGSLGARLGPLGTTGGSSAAPRPSRFPGGQTRVGQSAGVSCVLRSGIPGQTRPACLRAVARLPGGRPGANP
jgi:hypothetical protein